MKNILIISATPRSNYELAQAIAAQAPNDVTTSIVILEDMEMPLYSPKAEGQGIPNDISELAKKLIAADAYILVAPEYNGSIPPIVNNTIAWISRTSKEWRGCFINKFAVVATMSGGGGSHVVEAMRSQLSFLGSTVHAHSLVCSPHKPLNPESAKKIMADLSHWLR